ncbi:MAG: hypothetical protein FJY58_07945 [Betaproteobacteria bacterium]|nr:hypothetical protein [Betaproteobacteria bacterium]
MKKLLVSTVLLAASGLALAHGCPGEMKKIDAAMPTTKLSAQDTAKVKELRAKGEEQHKAGQHTESMKTLADAKKIMGIQ